MLNKLRNEQKQFISYSKNNLTLFLFIMGLTCLTYATKLFLYDYSVDTEQFMAQPDDVLRWWIRIGRYGLVFLKQITMFGDSMNVTLINVITYFLLGINTFLLCYLVWRLNSQLFLNKKRYVYVSSALFLSSPVIIEQTNFILQSVEVMIAVFLVLLSILFMQLFIDDKMNSFFVISCLLAWFSFAVYPSLVIAFILLSIMSILVSIKDTTLSFKAYFKKSFPYIAGSVLSFTCYLIFEKIILMLLNLKAASYMIDQSHIGKIPASRLFQTIRQDFVTYFIKPDTFFMCLITLFSFSLFLLILFKHYSLGFKIWCTVSLITTYFFVISPLWLLGHIGPIRALVPAVPIALFFLSLWLFLLIDTQKIIAHIAVVITIILVAGQVKITSDLGLTEYRLFEQEQALMQSIVYELESNYGISDFSNYKLAVMGKKEFDLGDSVEGEVIGRSFFNWNYNHKGGCSKKVANFLYTQGIKIGYVSADEFKQLTSYDETMTAFPQEGSIIIKGDIIILKF